jgi:hypothetical protein
MKTLINYAKELIAQTTGDTKPSLNLIKGPNGAFISITTKDAKRITLPVGKKSQNGTLTEFNVLITDDGQAIATVNQYEQLESVEL